MNSKKIIQEITLNNDEYQKIINDICFLEQLVDIKNCFNSKIKKQLDDIINYIIKNEKNIKKNGIDKINAVCEFLKLIERKNYMYDEKIKNQVKKLKKLFINI